MVAPVTYDDFGRRANSYLPYKSSSDNGMFNLDAFGAQTAFYETIYPSEQPAFRNEKFFYGKNVYEASPLNRVSRSFAPGNSWIGSEGTTSEKGQRVQYLVNDFDDNVRDGKRALVFLIIIVLITM